MTVTDAKGPREFHGELRRDSGGFWLRVGRTVSYRLTLLRTPVDLVEKQVIVTGWLNGVASGGDGDAEIEVAAIRGAGSDG
jgi:hypothetical protein